jgi:hypothetical protein
MKSAIAECALLLLAVAIWAEPALARSYLNCLTKEVVIVNAASGTTSSSTEEKRGDDFEAVLRTIEDRA